MVTRLADGVWWIDLGGVNAYLIDNDDGGALTLVDAGLPWQARALTRALTAVRDGPTAVDRVLLTHFDVDHVGGLNRLAGLDAPVYIGEADRPFLTRERRPPVSNRKGAMQRAFDWWRRPPSLPVRDIADGDEIGSFRAVHTPGHTPGHTAYVSEALSVALLGDLVRESDGRLVPSPWLLSCDRARVRESVRVFAERAPAFDPACVGHGTPFSERGSVRLADCRDGLAV